MTDKMKEKRAILHALSMQAKSLIDFGKAESINEGLKLIYSTDGHNELKSFTQWKESGQMVRKGEKALMLWAKPLSAQKEKDGKTEETDGRDFFPVAYVFSNLQVEPLKIAA